MLEITVVIPTYRRPSELLRAARSVLEQVDAPPFALLVVDNDPSQSAKPAFDELFTEMRGVSAKYVHEPNAGVANARNTAIEHVTSRFVAFLDDDQSVPENWLAELSLAHALAPAAVTFGPVLAVLPDGASEHTEYLEAFFSRTLDQQTGYIDHYYGCGNALLDLSLINVEKPYFDVAMNETGGEDDLLFQAIEEKGGNFAWCAEAPAYEHVPVSRANTGYTLRRAFAYGQGPITLARTTVPRQYGRIVMWMCVGFGKSVLNSLLYAVHFVTRTPKRMVYLDRAVRGIGKVFWWKKLKFYGSSAKS